MVVKLYIGNDRLDLFQDENIEVTSSITNSSDIAKNTTDYSKSFTVPASAINNQTFKHYYDANIDNTFDARLKVDGRIELDGIPYKTGKWRLEKVQVKKGNPSSYTITFFGNLVSLVDLLGDDELKDLDLSAFDHEYNSDNVRDGLTIGLFSSNLIYTLLPKKRYYYNSDPSDTTQTTSVANIAVTGTSNGVLWNDLKPSIRLASLIDAIESKYDIVFGNDFFGRDEFINLYMLLNNDSKQAPLLQRQLIDFTSQSGDDNGFDITDDVWTGDIYYNTYNDSVYFAYSIKVTPDAGFETTPYTIVVTNNDNEIVRIDKIGLFESDYFLIKTFDPSSFSYRFYIETSEVFQFDCRIFTRKYTGVPMSTPSIDFGQVDATANLITLDLNVSQNLPKLKTIDFLTGLFKMFKLVINQDGDEININTLDDYYKQGTLRDITRYVDCESHDVARGNILREIKYEFEAPSTLLNIEFEKNTGVAYGDEELKLTDDLGKPLDGTTLEYKVPFEQVVFERLTDVYTGLNTSVQYGSIIDDKLEPTNVKPFIYYNNIVDLATSPVSFINDTSTQEVLSGSLNTPAHIFPLIDQIYSTLFGVEFSTWDGSLTLNTLYSNHHKDYIESIFNVKRREFSFNAILPLNILSSLKLNDVLKIKDNYYRIDNFTLNLTTGQSKLNLINSFDNSLVDLATDTTSIFVDFREQSRTVYTRFVNPIIIDFDGTSFGVTWLSGSQSGNIITVNFDTNLDSETRDAYLLITDSVTLERVEVYLNQSGRPITMDSTAITMDSDIITFDEI